MKKAIFQAVAVTLVFLVSWLVLNRIDWVSLFRVQKISENTEQKLGELFLEVFKESEIENTNGFLLSALDSVVNHVCLMNDIERAEIKLHVINKDVINAFALPDGHLVIYSGLIANSEHQDEVAGVICHEIAHIELNHVMKKLMKEVGLSVLLSMATGGGGELIIETGKMLSSSAFDRSMEKEADLKAVDYLIKAKVNPEPLADFLYRLSLEQSETSGYLTWLNSHPDSEERAAYIIDRSKEDRSQYRSILADQTWQTLVDEIRSEAVN